jgi:hypothetical protein
MPIFEPSKNIVAGSNISTTTSGNEITVAVANVGSANGIASLDSSGKVPATQLPNSIMEYKGTWDASNNSPSLANGTGNAGDVYRTSVAGSQNFGAGVISFEVGDYVIYSGTVWEKSDSTDSGSSFRNKIHNGNFYIASRGTLFVAGANNNDTYNIDRWFILSNGNDIVDISRSTTEVPSYQTTSLALDVETINEKFGIAQIIEDIDCKELIGRTVTLSFKAKISSLNLNNLKAAVIAWNGTANVVTSDMVSAWGNANVNPTLKSNLSYVNTPGTPATGAFTVADTNWNSYSVTTTVPETVSGSPVTNLIVFIWSDTKSNALGNFLYLTEVQLEQSSTATSFERLPVSIQEQLCERFLPAFLCRGAERFFGAWGGAVTPTNSMLVYFPFRVPTRVPVSNAQVSDIAHFRGYSSYPNGNDALLTAAFLVGGVNTGTLIVTTSVSYNSGGVGFLYPASSGTGWIVFTGAEL